MAKRNEFKPDKPRSGLLDKLILTKLQRRSVLRWSLHALLLVALSVLQDVILCRFRLFGATTELVPVGIFLICLAEGLERGCIFTLSASCLYLFSGTAAGNYVIVFITALALLVTWFRQSFLQKGFAASMLCTVAAMMTYVMAVFLIGLFLGQTTFGRIFSHLFTGMSSLLAAPVLYPVVGAICAIGGDAWKE